MSSTRRLAAIMFTDLVGSTEAAQRDEKGALERQVEQEGLLRPLFRRYEGHEIKSTGDGFLVWFDSALRATECAVAAQRALAERNGRRPDDPLLVRIGIHLGDVEQREGDIFGDAVNIAARIEPYADPGGVCVSEPVFGQVRNKLSLSLEPVGERLLKGVREPMPIYRVALPRGLAEKTSGGSAPPRLAVLPLANISPDPKDEYFADGLTEELISALSNIRGLRVIARTSVSQYKATTKSISQIGSDLGVDSVIEGSVRKAGNHLRITLQLIDVRTQEHTWSENFDRELDDVFAVQRAVAQGVSESLKLRLLSSKPAAAPERAVANPEAYGWYLKGRVMMGRASTKAEFAEVIEDLEKAIRIDPTFAAAHAALSHCLSWQWWTITQQRGTLERAKELAQEAIRIDPGLAEAHVSMAQVLTFDWQWRDAERECLEALSLSPSLAEAHLVYRRLLLHTGRPAEGLREAKLALELDPFSASTNYLVGTAFLYYGNPAEAIPILRNALAVEPGLASARANLGLSYVRVGRVEEGIAELERADATAAGGAATVRADLAWAYLQAGKKAKVSEILGDMVERAKTDPSVTTELAGLYAMNGEPDKAFDVLNEGLRARAGILPSVRIEFWLDSLRLDPRFGALLRGMGLVGPTS